MKLYILFLIMAAFLQTSFIPINLILVLIISRAFVFEDPLNYYLGFAAGIFLGILSIYNIGFWPIAFLLLTKLINLSKKLPLSKNIFPVILISFGLITGVEFLQSQIFHQYFELPKPIIETILIIPVYYLIKIWEGRFIVKPEIKLKIRER